jgi:putative tryptophan/tyrosine transport system substrate-binding protein
VWCLARLDEADGAAGGRGEAPKHVRVTSSGAQECAAPSARPCRGGADRAVGLLGLTHRLHALERGLLIRVCGVVASLNRPGANITGIAFLVNGLASKQLELLHRLVPAAEAIGFLVNPKDPNAETDAKDAQDASASLGLKLVIGSASTESEFETSFAGYAQQHVGALFVDAEPFLLDHRKKIIALANQASLPIVSQFRLFAVDGGLASYGTSLTDANRLLGGYTGRILKGEKPADLPIVQSTKFDLVINLKTAKSLGLTVPPTMLTTADEVIE